MRLRYPRNMVLFRRRAVPAAISFLLFFLFASLLGAQESPAEQVSADTAAASFALRCASCHSIGGVGSSAPDLLPSTQWSEQDLHVAIKRMEKNVGPLSDEEVDGLVSLMKDPLVKERVAEEQKRMTARFTSELAPASPAKGKQLFHGSLPLKGGGMACSACHRFDGEGGDLARDLSDVNARMGETALRSAIQQASFNVMRSAYREHPITAQEAHHLTAYLGTTSEPGPRGLGAGSVVSIAGAAGGFLFMGVVGYLYRGRQKGTRKKLLQHAKEN